MKIISQSKYAANVLTKNLFYLHSQYWNKQKIEKYYDIKLKRLVEHAGKHVPYYRRLFKKIGLNIEKFRGRRDMRKIPLLDKETLRKNRDEFIADNAKNFGVNWDSTSGSTGKPLKFIVDNNAKAHKLGAVIRSYQWAEYLPLMNTFSIQSYSFQNKNDLYKKYDYFNMWRFNARLMTINNGIKIINMINRIKPKIIIGYPFSITMLTKIKNDNGLYIHPVKSIVTAGETLSNKRRSILEKEFKCKVFDFYSMHENVAILSECKYGNKHICEDFAFNEIVDKNGNEIKIGIGELVGTSYYNYAMPLLRYRLGDDVEIDENKKCRCGREFRVVNRIIGRQNDFIQTPGGKFLGNVLEHSIDNAEGVILSQIVQDDIEHLYINILSDGKFDDNSKVKIIDSINQRTGEKFKIDFKIVNKLEKNKSGKTPFMLSKIGNEFI